MGEYLFCGATGGVIGFLAWFFGFFVEVLVFFLEPFFVVGEVVLDGVEGVCGYGWVVVLCFVYEVC